MPTTTIPLLPCHSINETIDFYRALGFEVTYQQTKPNNYAIVKYDDWELHFFSMKGYEPANSYSTCYVLVSEIDALYSQFTSNLKRVYGRVPSAGIPRVIPLKNKTGRREFIVVDPGGNWIRIGQVSDVADEDAEKGASLTTPLARATNAAKILEDVGKFPEAAAKIDAALAKNTSADAVERVRALIFRAGLAVTMQEFPNGVLALAEMRKIELTDAQRVELAGDLERVVELEQILLEVQE